MTHTNQNNDAIKNYILIIITLASFLEPFMVSSINVALPSIGEDLKMDAVLLSWVATAYLIAIPIFLVPFGRIADIYGRKKVFVSGLALFSLSSLLCALSNSGMMLIAMRVLQGIGGAMTFGTGFAILVSVFPVGERGKALGINVASVYIGLSAGPFLGGLLTQHLGWRSIFIATVCLGSVLIAIMLRKLKGDWAASRGEKLDITGSIIYGITLVAVMYGFSRLPDLLGVWIILIGIFALAVFVFWERKVKDPILDINLFRNNLPFAFSNLAMLIHYSATFAATFLLSLYLQYIKGFTPQSAGLILISTPVIQAICSPIAGRLSDRFKPRLLASVGMALTVVGLSLFIFLNRETTLAFTLFVLILLGFSRSVFVSPNANAIMSSVPEKYFGVASATQATMRQVGMMFSMGIVMLLFSIYIGREQITPEYYDLFLTSMKVAFSVFAFLCFVGTFASLARGKVR
jgi:EmrB/QacA subfamily drug resistance transporter